MTHTEQDVRNAARDIYWDLLDALKEETSNLSEDDRFTEDVYNAVFRMFQKGE